MSYNQKEYLKQWKSKHPDYMKVWETNHRSFCLDCNKLIDRSSKRCLSCARKNKGNHKWKGGITSFYHWIRNTINNREWITRVMQRDNYICQECGKRGNMEVHHKYSFANLVKDFLEEYNQFSPIDDKETLVRLSINYKPFWDLNNGVTLCLECHRIGANKCVSQQKRLSNE